MLLWEKLLWELLMLNVGTAALGCPVAAGDVFAALLT
jgi:hypothetical protein